MPLNAIAEPRLRFYDASIDLSVGAMMCRILETEEMMKQLLNGSMRVCGAIAVALGLTLAGVSSGWAQDKGGALQQKIVGTWSYASSEDTKPDGSKFDRWGKNAKGSLTFTANGRYSFIITRGDVAKFAGKTINDGTAEENKAAFQGMIAHFGTYSIDEKTKTLVTRVEGSSYPNLVGVDQKRIISALTDSELKYENPASTNGATAKVGWKRVK
jgi:hypothetical protein